MDEENRLEQGELSPLMPRTQFRPPNSLLWLSRKLGHAATTTARDVKAILKKEVPVQLPSRAQLFGSRYQAAPETDPHADPKVRKEESREKSLKQIVKESHEVLAHATTVFPFTLFPDKVIVDRTKVTILKRNFFWSEDVISIRIEDVLNVLVSTDLIFGSLNIASRVMNSTDHYQIKFFWRNDAIRLKHIIQGYVIAQHNNIKISHLEREELVKDLMELGQDTAAY